MKKLVAAFFAVLLAASLVSAQKKPAAKPFTTSGFYDGINIGEESGDVGGMSVFLTESDGQLYALVMTAAGDFNTPLLLEAKASGAGMRTIEFVLPEENGYTVGGSYKGVVSANALTLGAGDEKEIIKRSCGNLYSNISLGSGGDYGGMEIFVHDMAGSGYALVTFAEGVLQRPVLVPAEMNIEKPGKVAFTVPTAGGERKFTGTLTKTGLTLMEGKTRTVLKDKCYK